MSSIDNEILDGFIEEAKSLLAELDAIVQNMEKPHSTFPNEKLAEFAQKIDRIMGAAKTIGQADPNHIGLRSIGFFTEIGKALGYKAGVIKDPKTLPIFSAFFADIVEIIRDLVEHVRNPEKANSIAKQNAPTLAGRLSWLAKKVDPESKYEKEFKLIESYLRKL